MSETRRSLHLVIEGLSPERREELAQAARQAGNVTEVFALTESNGHEALEKIFAAETVAVWGPL